MLSKALPLSLLLNGPAFAGPLPSTIHLEDASLGLTPRAVSPWTYRIIGDSWGSRVSYNQQVLYDGNIGNCLRTKESHGPQMEADTSWTGPYSSDLRDAACSGSQLVDLAKGSYQMGEVGNPNVVVMTSGGNNAGFGIIVNVCIYHADPNHNYGPAYKDDDPNNPKGECAKALSDATNYINKFMAQDLINTINDILTDPSVSNNPGFLLYVTGYAQFFGTDYDSWCEQEHWNLWSLLSPVPYLSKELRVAFNEHVTAVNNLYITTIQTQFADKVRFIDLDVGFQGHRFCEVGATHNDQFNTDTNFNGVWLWNLNWPWQVADVPPPPGVDADEPNLNATIGLFPDGGGVTAWSGSGSGDNGNVPSAGWRLRPFHPRYSGYTSIKNAILAQLKTDGLPKAPAPASSTTPAPTPTPQYAAGTCCFHLDEWEDCDPDSDDLFANITLLDNNKNVIYQTSQDDFDNGDLGDPINAGNGTTIQGPLPDPIAITGEHDDDYVQFTYGSLSWQSKQPNGGAQCSVGGWNPRDGPLCDNYGVGPPEDSPTENQMDCCFPC